MSRSLRFSLLMPAALMLSAQADPWLPLAGPDAASKALRYHVRSGAAGPEIELKNEGSETLHFHFQVFPSQTAEEAVENGRMHLAPGRTTGWMPLRVQVPGQSGTTPVRALNVQTGPVDQGVFLSEG